MSSELDPCPCCGALPCDWVERPHKQAATERERELVEVIKAHEQHMIKGQDACVGYLVPSVDPLAIDSQEFISRVIEHFDGPEQRRVQKLAKAALAKYGEQDD